MSITSSVGFETVSKNTARVPGRTAALSDLAAGLPGRDASGIARLPVDRSFVMRMERDAGNSVIVQSTISLAHNLDMSVVAEGVETQEQYRFLTSKGTESIQGYLFSKPVTAEELRPMLEDHHFKDQVDEYSGAARQV